MSVVPLPTRLFSLVSLDDATDVAHFRTADKAREWARRWYGVRWRCELLIWDNVADAAVSDA